MNMPNVIEASRGCRPEGASRTLRPLWLRLACLGCLAALALAGCAKYGEVSLPTYEHAQALFTICNLRDQSRLGVIEESIESAIQENRINSQEADQLRDIIADARNDDWREASRKSRLMMMEQVH